MEKVAKNNAKTKVLFLITKSNLGEKWDGTHFARLAQLVCEYLKRTGVRVDSVCKTEQVALTTNSSLQ